MENSPRSKQKKSKAKEPWASTANKENKDSRSVRATEEELKQQLDENDGYNAELQEELRIQQLKKDILSND